MVRMNPRWLEKAVAKILNCSAEQCRRLAEAKKIPVFRIGYRWKSTFLPLSGGGKNS